MHGAPAVRLKVFSKSDDYLVIFSPSRSGLQHILNVCSHYGLNNANKKAVLFCGTKDEVT